MSNSENTSKENYDAICKDMKHLADELEKNPNMPEDLFKKILKRYERLGKMLEQYAKMTWKK
jgi:hypothetical protein